MVVANLRGHAHVAMRAPHISCIRTTTLPFIFAFCAAANSAAAASSTALAAADSAVAFAAASASWSAQLHRYYACEQLRHASTRRSNR
jgi:hypothetical protein